MAAENARGALDWKYAPGLPLDNGGFDFSVLSEFRARVAAGALEAAALDALLERLKEEGMVKAGGKQRTDSTHVTAAVAALNRLELAGESVRAALEHSPQRTRTGPRASSTRAGPAATRPR